MVWLRNSYAIAYATLAHLVSRIRPLTLFATHYHALTTEFADNALVQMRHMAFVVDAHQYGPFPFRMLAYPLGCREADVLLMTTSNLPTGARSCSCTSSLRALLPRALA